MKKKILPIAWGSSTVLIIALATFMSGETTHFFGITDDQEQTISFEYPVEITRTHVVEGETVKKHQILMEARSETLQSNLAIIKDAIQELTSKDKEDIATLKSKMTSLKAQQEAQRADLDGKINSLRSQHKLNKSFLKQLSDSDDKPVNTSSSPILDQIHGLRLKRDHLMASSRAEIENIHQQLTTEARPVDSQIDGLKEKKAKLLRQVAHLTIRADFTGRIGSLLFKSGETVSPYQPVLTVHSSSPSYVKAYINENVVNKVTLGQEVWVQSTSSQEANVVSGNVESLGSRIVEYPARLKKNPLVSAWGREVVVHLNDEHGLLLGEKVIVQLNKPKSLLSALFSSSEAIASDTNKALQNTTDLGTPIFQKDDTQQLDSTNPAVDIPAIEASGVLRDATTGGYMLVGDEDVNGIAELYHLDNNGMIQARVTLTDSPQHKTPKIGDIESISRDDEYIYISASLSHNKRNTLSDKRRRFIRLEQVGSEILFRGAVDLYTYLEVLSETTKDSMTKQFLAQSLASNTINIEAHSIINEHLFIGFKNPLNTDGRSVILKLDKVNRIFSGQPPVGVIWKTLNMKDRTSGESTVLTDMTSAGDRILLLSVRDDAINPVSRLWCLNPASDRMIELAVFENLKAEGITKANTGKHAYLVVFDEGGKSASRYLVINDIQSGSTGESLC